MRHEKSEPKVTGWSNPFRNHTVPRPQTLHPQHPPATARRPYGPNEASDYKYLAFALRYDDFIALIPFINDPLVINLLFPQSFQPAIQYATLTMISHILTAAFSLSLLTIFTPALCTPIA